MIQVATRKAIAFWFKGNEMRILADCHNQVGFAIAAIDKIKLNCGGGIPINKAFRAIDDPNQVA